MKLKGLHYEWADSNVESSITYINIFYEDTALFGNKKVGEKFLNFIGSIKEPMMPFSEYYYIYYVGKSLAKTGDYSMLLEINKEYPYH